jgi:negative regulator of flagellin synthesis FlgM
MVDGAKTNRAERGAGKSPAESVKGDVLEELDASSKVAVSPKAQEARRIKELALAAPDVDEAKVAKFRQLIDDGKYKVDSKAVADRMVDDHMEMES